MEKKTSSYFKHLFKSLDVFLALFVGLILAVCLWYLDLYDIFYRIKPSYAGWLKAIYNGALFTAIAGCFVALYPTLKEKTIIKGDILLLGLTSLSLVSTILFGINGNIIACVLWAIAIVISVIYFSSRIKEHETNDELESLVSTNSYYATLTRKYNIMLLFLTGVVIAVVGLLLIDKTSIFTGKPKYYVVGAVLVCCVGSILHAVISKKAKVGWIDACLVVLMTVIAFGFNYIVKLKDPRIVRFIFLWILGALSVGFSIVIRSIFCDTNMAVKVEKKRFPNYLGVVFSKYHFSFIALLGVVAGFCVSLVTRYGRISEMFSNVRSSIFAIIAIMIIIYTLAIIVLGVMKNGYTSKKANLLDAGLCISFVGGVFGLGMVYVSFSYQRLILVLVPTLFALISMCYRMTKVDLVSQEFVEEDSTISVDVKLVIDGDEIKAYCDGAEVEVNVVRNNETEVTTNDDAVVEDDTNDSSKEEEVDSVSPSQETVVEDNNQKVSSEERLIIAKRSFENKIKFASPKAKKYYSEIKNALMVYKTKSRVSKKAEVFRKKGLLAKISVSGKSIRVHLALDPTQYDENKYHQIDLGARRAFKEVPFTMKIRSDLACKRAIELIDELALSRGLKANKKYEKVNYAEGLDIDGVAILEKLGLIDQLTTIATKQQAENLTDDVLKFIPVVEMSRPLNEAVENVYIDTALKYVTDTISADTLHETRQIPATVELINVKARTGLDKKITVYADEIDPLAAKLVLLTGGKVFKIVRK